VERACWQHEVVFIEVFHRESRMSRAVVHVSYKDQVSILEHEITETSCKLCLKTSGIVRRHWKHRTEFKGF
jgi:hypothetical protein